MKAMLREKMVESGDFLEIDIFEVRKKAKSRKKEHLNPDPYKLLLTIKILPGN